MNYINNNFSIKQWITNQVTNFISNVEEIIINQTQHHEQESLLPIHVGDSKRSYDFDFNTINFSPKKNINLFNTTPISPSKNNEKKCNDYITDPFLNTPEYINSDYFDNDTDYDYIITIQPDDTSNCIIV